MVKKDRYALALIGIFLLVLGIRLYLSFQLQDFEEPAYFVLRQVESIRETGVPLFYDELSYGGRQNTFAPFYYYLLASFSFFMPLELVGKIIPNVFASFIVIFSYMLVQQLTSNKRAALFTALLSGFMPIFFSTTFNSMSIYSFIAPFMLLSIYLFARGDSRHFNIFIIFFLILCITQATVFLLVLSMIFYLLLCKLEDIKIKKEEIEISLFALFFALWSQFLIYKKAFLSHGFLVVWQNIPQSLLSQTFRDFNMLSAILQIGILPFVFGIYMIFRFIYKTKNRLLALLTSFTLSTLFLMWTKLIELNAGMVFLGMALAILFGNFYSLFEDYVKKTKADSYTKPLFGATMLLFALTSLYPSLEFSLGRSTIDNYTKDALIWAKYNTPEDSTIFAMLDEGHLINYFATRKNFADDNFLNIEESEKALSQISIVLSSRYEVDALEILGKGSFIMYSERAAMTFAEEKPKYTSDERCFRLVYDKKVKIFEVLCRLEAEKVEI